MCVVFDPTPCANCGKLVDDFITPVYCGNRCREEHVMRKDAGQVLLRDLIAQGRLKENVDWSNGTTQPSHG